MRTAALLITIIAVGLWLALPERIAQGASPHVTLTVKVTTDGDGRGSVTTSVGRCRKGTCRFQVRRGATVSMTHRARPPGVFARWAGACSGSKIRCSVTASRPRRVEAHFTISRRLRATRRRLLNTYLGGFAPLSAVKEGRVKSGDSDQFEETLPDADAPLHKTRWKCTRTPYTLTANPDKIVLRNPDATKLYVGGLLQGSGYAGGLGSLKSLPIGHRSPLTLYLDLLGSPDITRTVTRPNAGRVQKAINTLVTNFDKTEAPIPAVAHFRQTWASTVQQGLLDLGFSARYLGASVQGSLNTSHEINESTVMATFEQRYFTVSAVTPELPADYFDLSAMTVADLKEHARLGRIGEDNPPVAITSVAYGRTYTMTVTSKTTHDKLSASLSAAFKGAHGEASANLTLEQKRILSTARIEVVSVGGDEQSFADAVRSGNLQAVLARPSKLATAVPISYQVDNISDNSAARFSETTNYNLTECKPQIAGRVSVGEIAKLVRFRVLTRNCPHNLEWYGSMGISGHFFFTRRYDQREQFPVWWPLPADNAWPVFSPPDPERYGIADLTYPADGFYVVRFRDPMEGPADPGLNIEGALISGDGHTTIWSRPVPVPFSYGDIEISPENQSPGCPQSVRYTMEKVADLTVLAP